MELKICLEGLILFLALLDMRWLIFRFVDNLKSLLLLIYCHFLLTWAGCGKVDFAGINLGFLLQNL